MISTSQSDYSNSQFYLIIKNCSKYNELVCAYIGTQKALKVLTKLGTTLNRSRDYTIPNIKKARIWKLPK